MALSSSVSNQTSDPSVFFPSRTPNMPAAGWPLGTEGLVFGCDYNPEQWTLEVWREDARLMAAAGVNLISVGMFSWANIEPRRGEYDFAWLDEIFEIMHSAGIRIDLATPTAAPPAWFFRENPSARVIDRRLMPLGAGSRGMACPASRDYRAACLDITRRLAERYGNHPALAMWHVHNEYGAPVNESFSDNAQEAFRCWSQLRYGSVEALNKAWGTAFWGQTIGEWADVSGPLPSPSVINPSMELDWRRFNSDLLLECYLAERDLLRKMTPGIPITTNFHSCDYVDQWRWAKEVDVVATDHYLWSANPRGFVELAQTADLTRSIAGNKPWMLMEHSTSGVNWQPRNIAKNEGEMARNSLSHVGRGADAIMFFQWRASLKGAEKFHSAMLPHGGTDTRIWKEVTELGAELLHNKELRGSRVVADVAIVADWNSQWAQDLDWRPSVDLKHKEQSSRWYERLWLDHVTCDFVHPESDLSTYKLVLVPALYLLTDDGASNFSAYVAAGGTLVVGPFSGVVDENDGVRTSGWNAALADLLGVRVLEYCPLRAEDTASLVYTGADAHTPKSLLAEVWTEDLLVDDAEVLGVYSSGPRPEQAAVTRRILNSGSAWYIGSDLSVTDLEPIFSDVYRQSKIATPDLPRDVELIVRTNENKDSFATVINHGPVDHKIVIPGTERIIDISAAGSVIIQI